MAAYHARFGQLHETLDKSAEVFTQLREQAAAAEARASEQDALNAALEAKAAGSPGNPTPTPTVTPTPTPTLNPRRPDRVRAARRRVGGATRCASISPSCSRTRLGL